MALPDELDMANAAEVQASLQLRLAEQPETLVVDVSAVTFLGSAGIAVLLATRGQADRLGVAFRLVGARTNQRVWRVLEVTGVAHLFDIDEDAAEAAQVATPP